MVSKLDVMYDDPARYRHAVQVSSGCGCGSRCRYGTGILIVDVLVELFLLSVDPF
jgi:hypothetical protein